MELIFYPIINFPLSKIASTLFGLCDRSIVGIALAAILVVLLYWVICSLVKAYILGAAGVVIMIVQALDCIVSAVRANAGAPVALRTKLATVALMPLALIVEILKPPTPLFNIYQGLRTAVAPRN